MTSEESVEFDTAISASGNKAGIVVPPEVVAALGAGSRPAVVVDLNGYTYRTSIGVRAGRHLIGVSAAVRADSGLQAGDLVHVRLSVATEPRAVDVPDDFAEALASSGTRAFFDRLANSLQRYHIDNINDAKQPETRSRRIAKAVDLFRAERKR